MSSLMEYRCRWCEKLLFRSEAFTDGQVEVKCTRAHCRKLNEFGPPTPGVMLEGRCAGCGRVMLKFTPGLHQQLTIKCTKANCRVTNRFVIDSTNPAGRVVD